MDGYENLVTAIIVRAAKDYKFILRRCVKHPYDREWQSEKTKIERFFRSSWYKTLTNLDGELLIKKIKEEVAYEGKRLLGSSV